jgi:hypothetical protein
MGKKYFHLHPTQYYDRATYRYPPVVAFLVGFGGRIALVAADVAVAALLGAMTLAATAAPKGPGSMFVFIFVFSSLSCIDRGSAFESQRCC